MRPTALISACLLALAFSSPALAKETTPAKAAALSTGSAPPAAEVATSTGLPGSAPGAAAVFSFPRSNEDQRRADALEPELSSQLRARGTQIADFSAAFPPGPPRSLKKSEQLLSEAKAAFNNLDLEGAKKLFDEAVAFHFEHAYETTPQQIAPLFIYQGATAIFLNDPEGAKQAFRNAAGIALDVPPDPEAFAPEVIEGYGAAWEWVSQQKPGKLEILSEPPGAEIFLAGKSVGMAPVTVEHAFGRVRVEARRAGYDPTAIFAEVKSGTTSPVTVPLQAVPGLVAIREMARELGTPTSFAGKDVSDEARAVGERIGARYLVIAAAEGDDAEVQAWDLQAGTRLQGLSIQDDGTPEVARKIDAWTRGQYTPGENDFLSKLPGVMKRPWFWAAVGGVAAATAGAVWVGTSANAPRAPNWLLGIP